jgi:hypothetical protein
LKWEEKYLFKHPMEFQLKEPNKVRKELGCISIEEMMGKDKWKFNYVVGYIMYMSYRNSKEWGKYYDISFEDETMRSRFLLHPKHFPNFKKVEDILHKHMVHHHPIVLNLSSNSDALINRERYMRKGPTCWLQKPEIGQKYTAIKSPFKIHGRGINEL